MSAAKWFREQARNAFVTGTIGGAAALVPALLRKRFPAAPVNAVSHIWSGRPAVMHAMKPTARNAAIGLLLHQGAAVFWAGIFEPLFGRAAQRSSAAAVVGGTAIAAAAYVTDYHIVARRFRPGFEVSLSGRSLFLVYAALGIAFAACARSRGLRDHQVRDRDEGDERQEAERGPDAVVQPVARR